MRERWTVRQTNRDQIVRRDGLAESAREVEIEGERVPNNQTDRQTNKLASLDSL